MVEIKKLEKQTWGAKHQSSGELLQKFSECKDTWVPGISSKTQAYVTGLTAEDEAFYEEKLSKPKGTFSPNSSYWADFKIIIPEKGIKLNEDDVFSSLKIKVIKACPKTAASEAEGMKSKKKEYFIYSQNNEARISNNEREYKIKAYIALDKLSTEQVMDTLYMIGMDPSNMTPEVARDAIGTEVDADPIMFCNIIAEKDFTEKVRIVKWIRAGILTKSGLGATFNLPIRFGDLLLGNNLAEAVLFLRDKANSNILKGIIDTEKLKKK